MTPEQSRIVNSTIHKYIRQEENAIMRNQKLLALLQARGRIVTNSSGDLLDWKVKYRRSPVSGYADNDVLTFTQRDRRVTAQLDWRGYTATDSVTKMQDLMNKGTEAIVKMYSAIASDLKDDIDEEFGKELYVDGNATGNSKRIHGIESFMGNSGAISTTLAAAPSDTYAGLSTALAAKGGTWTGTWPSGYGDNHYDYWSPLIVDYTSASMPQTTKTWANTCETALRYGIVKGRKNRSVKGKTDLVLMEDEMYRQFLEKQSAKERLNFQRTDSQKATLLNLGYTDVSNFEGTEITSEYGVPVGVGYGWVLDHMELHSLQGELFVPDGPDWSISTRSYRFAIDFLGNLRFKQTKFFTKYAAVT